MSIADYSADWVSAPGQTMLEMLEEGSKTVDDLASHLRWSVPRVQTLLEGEEELSQETADSLGHFFGTPSSFWINRESQFRADLFAMQSGVGKDWLEKLPMSEMVAYRWIDDIGSSKQLIRCLNFFGCSGVAEWRRRYGSALSEVLFRKSSAFDTEVESVSAWLRQGERLAGQISTATWDPQRLRSILPELRALTRVADPSRFLPELTRLCAAAGVAVVIVRTPKKCPVSGAARFVSQEKAVVQLSFRYLSDDHFWFSFFHELGHLLLHRGDDIHLEGAGAVDGKEEEEANGFAADVLVPAAERPRMLRLGENTREIVRFSTQIGVSPGIIVGQMQHYKTLHMHRMNSLKKRYSW